MSTAHRKISNTVLIGLVFFLLSSTQAAAALLGEEENPAPLFQQIAEALDAYGIDILPNLNDRQLARNRSFQPRLGRFPDLPAHRLPTSSEIEAWESSYIAKDIGSLVVLENHGDELLSVNDFWHAWKVNHSAERGFISFALANQEQAAQIADVLDAYGHSVLLFDDSESVSAVARFYATAAVRMALDSRAARRIDSSATEMSFLGERVRRNSASIFRDETGDRGIARQEPPVFLKESLGDEFSESTVREIIVPGGVALGETAYLSIPVVEMTYADGRLYLFDDAGERWELPGLAATDAKALFDYAERSFRIQSDSIVDIDGDGRVKMSAALRDTDIGFEIMHADTLPFEYVRNLQVTKSVIIDTGVDWFGADNNTLEFASEFEVRFLSADNMRLAQTRVALEYEYESESAVATYKDKWGRDKDRLRENMDYHGLGNDMHPVAEAAGWVGLMRKVLEENIPFLEGRYEFMKLDKAGQATPARY